MHLIKGNLRTWTRNERWDSLMMLGIRHDQSSKLQIDAVVDRSKSKFSKTQILKDFKATGQLKFESLKKICR